MPYHHPIVEAATQALKSVSGWLWLRLSNAHRIARSRRRPAIAPPLLVMGSLRSGGTGKTDLVAWIGRRHPDLALLAHPTGDEDTWLRERFAGRVFVHDDFLQAWAMARQAGFEAALSDGGLQDPALDGCPAICLDLDEAPALQDLLPFGRYRELSPRPRKRLLRVSLRQDLSPRLEPASLPPPGTRVVAACAVARAGSFFEELERAGLVLVEKLAFGDHRRFASGKLRSVVDRHPGLPWLVTEKDASRGELPRLPPGSAAVGRILSPSRDLTESVDALVEEIRSRR